MPKHFRIAEVFLADVQDWIARINYPGSSTVIAVREALILKLLRINVTREDQYQWRLTIQAQAARVVVIHDRATREGHHAIGKGNRHRQVLPVNQIPRDRMTPTNVARCVPEGVVLIEQMVLALEKDQTIRVVHPVLGRREMKTWTARG